MQTNPLNTIPITAWEQAVIVVLFAVIFVLIVAGLLNWFGRQQNKWQAFIAQMNKDWQNYMTQREQTSQKQQDRVNTENNSKLGGALAELTKAVTILTGKFDTHVADESATFDALLTPTQKALAKKLKKERQDE